MTDEQITAADANAAREAHRLVLRHLEARIASGGARPTDEEQQALRELRTTSCTTVETALFEDPAAEAEAVAVAGRELLNDASFQQAVRTARAHIPIQECTTIESAWCDFVIVRARELVAGRDPRYTVYAADAWDEPTGEQPMLPWAAPTGEPVARVDHDGRLTMLAPVAA
jgi:hypothetical protein